MRRLGRLVLACAGLAGVGFHLAAQYPTLSPPPFSTSPPRAEYRLVNAFPGVSFPQSQDRIISLAVPPGRTNELYVTGHRGKIFVITNLARPTKAVFLDITADTYAPGGESGLVGLAFHPRYEENGYFYVAYTRTNRPAAKMYDVVSRFQRDPKNPWRALPKSEQVLIAQLDINDTHQAGDLHFGPDGYLYVSLGDGGGGTGVQASQRIDRDFFGGILRLDVDGRPGSLAPNPHPAVGSGYWIPQDNPFVGADQFNALTVNPDQVRTEFWAVGFRNPYRIAFDPLTGDLYAADVGDLRLEEVNRVVAGGNYGWGYHEGSLKFRGTPPPGYRHVPPVYQYGRSGGDPNFQGASVIGGLVYRGTRYPDLSGQYLFADYVSRHIWALPSGGNGASEVWKVATASAGISGFGLHPATGEILLVEMAQGRIAKLVRNEDRSDAVIPQTLSATRVFSNLQNLAPTAGVVPYEVATPFWSDYAIKKRWFFMQEPGAKITRDEAGGWKYPTGTVWVKHFDFEHIRGNPESRRRLETRFVVKTADGVYGLTYRWRPNGSDADLVPDSGMDEDLEVVEGGVRRTQRWHYPSRSECLSCHNPSAGFALGFSSRQLNRDVSSGSGWVNQMLALSDRGVFDHSVTPAEAATLPRMAAVDDETAPLELRFRSFLDANCAYCHLPGGPGQGFWDGRLETPLEQAGIVDGILTDEHGIAGARVIKIGDPNGSMLLRRIAEMGALHMPPLATAEVSQAGVDVVTRWLMRPRTHWLIGAADRAADSPPGVPYEPYKEFAVENALVDTPPGAVTRSPGDPEYDANNNPGPDDDFYLDGWYPAGFNRLASSIRVPQPEPAAAWERAISVRDPVNRIHFILAPEEEGMETKIQLRMELTRGGYKQNGEVQAGFYDHDVVIRFYNAEGQGTVLYANRISRSTTLDLEFTAAQVGAKPGPNTLSIARVGPSPAGISAWVNFNYLELAVSKTEASELPPQPDPVPDPEPSPQPDPEPEPTPEPIPEPTPEPEPVPEPPPAPTAGRFTEWQLGRKNYKSAEFSMENAKNDLAPGKVTRVPGDPRYVANSNPKADDDHYLAGAYPPGFNGLKSELVVPVSEPDSAFERALTITDKTNRVHFIVSPLDLGAAATMTVRADLFSGGSRIRDLILPGFFEHDVVVRFRNGRGESTVVYASQISKNTTLEVEFSLESVRATAGPNTLEFVRPGPIADRTGAWILFDQVRLEIRNPQPPVAPPPPADSVPEEPSVPDTTTGGSSTAEGPPGVRWVLGVRDNKDGEFSSDQGGSETPPGRATRLPADPLFDGTSNPGPDDDFYMAGRYPAGFNGLTEDLVLSLSEPVSAWEKALSMADPTNRLHFVLKETDLGPQAKITLRTILFHGASAIGNAIQPGSYMHDVVIRFRNGRGESTELYSNRVTLWEPVELKVLLSSVGATVGPNTLEFVRVGPNSERTSAWITFDHLELEVANPNPPVTPSASAPEPVTPPPSDPPFPESSPTDPTPEGGTTPETSVISG